MKNSHIFWNINKGWVRGGGATTYNKVGKLSALGTLRMAASEYYPPIWNYNTCLFII